MRRRPTAVPPSALAPAAHDVPRRRFLGRALAALGLGALVAGRTRPLSAAAAPADRLYAVEPFIGEIALFGFAFAPTGWAPCHGQTLPISEHPSLYSLLGNTYGGDGTTTFALPDLRGRVPLGFGAGAGLTDHVLGHQGGAETHQLLEGEMPSHTHALRADSANGVQSIPDGGLPARNPAGIPAFGLNASTALRGDAADLAGGNLPHNNMQPYLALNWCIALEGVFPPQS